MKKLLIIGTCLLFTSFIQVDKKDYLVKTWRVQRVELFEKVVAIHDKAMKEPNFSEADWMLKNVSLAATLKMYEDLKESTFTYQKDGIYKFEGLMPETGKWSLSKDERYIIYLVDTKTTPDTLLVNELSDKSMKLATKDSYLGEPLVMEFVPK